MCSKVGMIFFATSGDSGSIGMLKNKFVLWRLIAWEVVSSSLSMLEFILQRRSDYKKPLCLLTFSVVFTFHFELKVKVLIVLFAFFIYCNDTKERLISCF